ncbi:hypothetical protein HNP73_003522 [Amaricoccus macauensis]|uniref:O-antigen polymerase n=1 Tax=Amaricoccus macauensis TaxID=57001 RepID=A0A840SSJ8_9RHOB|nr:hypothetical protein [Amaricoccus macauensis]MBB5223568.1 hypothetical protein [Amaricoccus macauensis]
MKIVRTRLTIWDALVLSSPFMSGLFFDSPIGNLYLFYIPLSMYLFGHILVNGNLRFPASFAYMFFLIVFLSVIGSLAFSTPIKYLISYMPPIILTFLAYHAYIRDYNFDIERIFRKYYAVAVYFSIFAFVQEAFWLAGSTILFAWALIGKTSGSLLGVVGLSSEPSNFAVALMPAVYFALYKILVLRKITLGAVAVIAAQLLTLSALGYMGIIASILLILPTLARRRLLFFTLASPFILYLVISMISVDVFAVRFADTLEVLRDKSALKPYDVNLSTYTLLVNYYITKSAFFDNYYLGTGIGSYYEIYSRYIGGFEVPSYLEILPGNNSASSFLLKVTAEMGIVGLALSIFFLVRFFSLNVANYINHAFFVTLIIIYLRLGMYFVNGVPFIVMMYIYSYQSYRRKNPAALESVPPRSERFPPDLNHPQFPRDSGVV